VSHTSLTRLAGLAAFGLAACGGSSTGPSNGGITAVTISPPAPSIVVGGTWALVARDQAGSHIATGVTWATSAPAIATVNGNGVLTAVAEGSATITATANGKSGTATVSVTLVTLTSVVAGGAHSCGLTADGSAWCWGRGESGQLGVSEPPAGCIIDSALFACSPAAIAVEGGLHFSQLDAGGTHTCGLTSAGAAYCWGLNQAGQLGDNSTTDRSVPVAVAGGLSFTSITTGVAHTCGLVAGGTAYCWGFNNYGQLGTGTTTSSKVPAAVTGGLTFQSLSAGGYFAGHTCGVTTGGAAYCWGDNGGGQLGIGTMDLTPHAQPAAVSGGLVFTTVSAGLGEHSCARTAAGAAYCWGQNTYGALGNGTQTQSFVPVAVSGGLAFAQLIAGGFIGHSCGLTSGATGYCWGENEVGAIGDGTTTDRLVPVPVAGGIGFTSLDAGYRHTCGHASSGKLYCWGSNRAGQLGVNSVETKTAPAPVAGQR
jgi:alpha-tubulin suppressor-like RCC1 family protein